MPSFFKKRLKAPKVSPLQSPGTAATSSNSATPESEGSNPSLSSAVVPPEATHAKDEVQRTNPIGDAFQAVEVAQPAFQDYEDSKLRKFLDSADEKINAAQEKIETAKSVIGVVKPAYESATMQVVRDVANKVADSLPGFMKALDEVAKLHPFISIVVKTFQVVIELNLKRRGNDKKIVILFDEMRDMMESLLQLSEIKDKGVVGPGGQTIEGRMQVHVKLATDDIMECANACDTYARMKTIVKVIQSSVWDEKLQDFIHRFTERRKNFVWALSIHIGVRVDEGAQKLHAKLDIVLTLFSNAMSPEQQQLAAFVEAKGGATAVSANNDILKELIKFRPATALDRDKTSGGKEGGEYNSHQDGDGELAVIKKELFDTPEIAIKKNWEVFDRKLKTQQKELEETIRRTMQDESDRVIGAITDHGPHNRISDPNIREIWKDMRWSGHVKARHFVLALRDYYRQQLERHKKDSVVSQRGVATEDQWALEWININRLQAIAEAFDDDASGFITIAEVNYFSTSRPEGWSLPHWVAYWAIGWQMTATKYRDMIVNLFAKMFAIRPRIHPANRNTIEIYLQTVWQKIATLTLSFVNANQPDSLQERFKSYVEAEEQRLRENLETFKYDIDAMDTLLLITGPGRIEKYLFPLLWLLLCRHFEIFRLCQHTIIHKDELWDSADTILWILDAVNERHHDLEALFKQQKLEPLSQFRVFASELYDYWHDFERLWTLEYQRARIFAEVEYDDSKENQDVDVSKLLNHPPIAHDLYPQRGENPASGNDATTKEAVRLILGRWYGVQIFENEAMLSMPITFYFDAPANHPQDRGTYQATAVAANGTDYNIYGDYTARADGAIEYSFTQTYAARIPKTYWTGTLTDGGETLSGWWGYKRDDQPHAYVYKRTPPQVLVDRPLSEEFTENRVKTLWKYALTAICNQARRRLCKFSWEDLKARRDVRKEYLELLLKETEGRLTKQDIERSSALARLSTFDDVRCFNVLQEYRQRAVLLHIGTKCDKCKGPIYGTRVVCMDPECGSSSTFDFCDKPECTDCTIDIQSRDNITSPHLPTHNLVKIRAPIVQHREIGKVLRHADTGLNRAKNLLAEMEYRKHEKNRSEGEDMEGVQGVADDADKQGSEEPVGMMEARVALAEQDAAENEVVALTCLKCVAVISPPCLYCIDCPEELKPFICWECDKQAAGFSHGDHHLATHNLVRCMPVEAQQGDFSWQEAEDDTKERLDALEHKLEGLTDQMQGLTSQMGTIEKLLHDLIHMRRE
ncbi:hypothetical protein V8D89_003213 [Ganoderma adspersum]